MLLNWFKKFLGTSSVFSKTEVILGTLVFFLKMVKKSGGFLGFCFWQVSLGPPVNIFKKMKEILECSGTFSVRTGKNLDHPLCFIFEIMSKIFWRLLIFWYGKNFGGSWCFCFKNVKESWYPLVFYFLIILKDLQSFDICFVSN